MRQLLEIHCSTPEGALFASHILTLEERGFGEWLVQSFGGGDPGPRPGWFHYDDDVLFSDMFSDVVVEFHPEIIKVAREGVCRAFNAFNREEGTYIGLYVLSSLAESLEAYSTAPDFAAILQEWIPSRGISANPPATAGQAIAFREALECYFRLFLKTQRPNLDKGVDVVTTEARGNFRDLCGWSENILRIRSDVRTITPARAPIYFLALGKAAIEGTSDARSLLDNRLREGYRREDDTLKELYTFVSTRQSGGDWFPYDVDAILAAADSFVARAVRRKESTPSASMIRYDYPLIRYDDPFENATASATNGKIPGGDDSFQYRTAMEDWELPANQFLPANQLYGVA